LLFSPRKGLENPIIKRAIDLCAESGMRVDFHEDTVEVYYSPTNKRIYTTWSQFLADAEGIFGAKMHDQSKADTPAPALFGRRKDDMTRSARGFADVAPMPAGAPAPDAAMAAAPAAPLHHAAPADPGELDALRAENANLKREMKILERAIRVVGMQSEEWKKEAEARQAELVTVREEVANLIAARGASAVGGSSGGDRYKQLRQTIVRRLHPDVAGTPEEKAYREKMFKSIWTEIEVLDKK